MAGLVAYGSGSDSDDNVSVDESGKAIIFERPKPTGNIKSLALPRIDPTPLVPAGRENETWAVIDPHTKEITYNAKYEDMFAPIAGPSNPYKTDNQLRPKNMITGFVEGANFNDFQFENQRRTFDTYGYAQNPSADSKAEEYVGNKRNAKTHKGKTVMESGMKSGLEKRKMVKNWDASDVEGYTGPWAKYADEELVSKPPEELAKKMASDLEKRRRFKKVRMAVDDVLEANFDERTILHITDINQYKDRNALDPPKSEGVNLREDYVPPKCYIPKKLLHTYTGHSKGVQCVKYFPKSAHLFMSAAMDGKAKLWDIYGNHSVIRTYWGHKMALRDVEFNHDGRQFLTASFDRYVKLWDTETGQVKMRFTNNKVPYCLRWNPDPDKSHLFLAGMNDKKILCWDARSGEITQEYDRHLSSVNSINFFDKNRRFASSADDKSLRIWEWDIPVDTKAIQHSGLHTIAYATMSPDQTYLAGQCMDNRIVLFQVIEEKLRFSKKKAFRGHMCNGYAVQCGWSPEMSYVVSGDNNGKIFIWDWKTHQILAKWRAHDGVCLGASWHPHEASKILTCGWDSEIKLWG